MKDDNKDKGTANKERVIEDYINSVGQAESSGGKFLSNSTSSAKGTYQFTDATWKEMEKKIGRKLNINSATDQRLAMKKLTSINAEALERNGLPVTNANLYTTHVLGISGGPKFLKKVQENPNELASKYASADTVKANPGLFLKDDKPVTAAELYNNLSGKMSTNNQSIPDDKFSPPQIIDERVKDNMDIPKPRIDPNFRKVTPQQLTDLSGTYKGVDDERQNLGLAGNTDFLTPELGLLMNEDDTINEDQNETNMARNGGKQVTRKDINENGTGLLNSFDEGGSHEDNKFGGIPLGLGTNGKPNTVEEGETKTHNDYVLSDKLKVNEQDAQDLFLSPKIIGMTFADASKYLMKLHDGNPYDKIIQKTAKKQLDSLTLGNEKARIAAEELEASLAGDSEMNQNQMFLGGNEDKPLNTETSNPTKDWYNQNPPMMSSSMETMAGPQANGLQQGADRGNSVGAASSIIPAGGGDKSTAGMIGGALSGLGDGLSAMGPKNKFFDQTDANNENTDKMVGATKDAVASYIGPMGLLFRGIEKAGNGIGDAIGGESGNYVSSAFSPDEAIMRNNADPDTKIGDKILGTILPFHAAKISKRNSDRRQQEASRKYVAKMNGMFTDKYELGGSLNSFRKGGHANKYDGGGDMNEPMTREEYLKANNIFPYGIYEDEFNKPSISGNDNSFDVSNLRSNEPFKESSLTLSELEASNKTKEAKSSKNEPHFETKGKSYMQYMPVLGDSLNYFDALNDKADSIMPKTLTNRGSRNYVDEERLTNKVNEAYNNSVNNLTDAANGSASAARANILAANAQRSMDMSDAFMKIGDANRSIDDKADQMDLNIDQFNIGQMDKAEQFNLGSKAAQKDSERAARDAIYSDLGAIGKEQTYENRLHNITGGYNSSGEYNPEGSSRLRKWLGLDGEDNKKENGGPLDDYANMMFDNPGTKKDKEIKKIYNK